MREAPAAALARARVVVAHNWPLATPRQRAACDAALDALCPVGTLRLRSHLAPLPLLRRVSATADAPSVVPIDALRGAPVLCFSALGCPAGLGATLAAAGADPVQMSSFPDHYVFSRTDLEAAVAATRALGDRAWLVTSAKDAARCEGALREGLAPLKGRALILEGCLRLVAQKEGPQGGFADDAAGAAALDALLAAALTSDTAA
jgi:hypothetical protein